MSVRVKLLARKGEVRFSLKNRHGQPGLSGPEKCHLQAMHCSKEHCIRSPGARGSRVAVSAKLTQISDDAEG